MGKNCIILIAIVFALVVLLIIPRKDYYEETNPMIDEIKRRCTMISPKFKNVPFRSGNKSYTKGKSAITLCIRDPTTKQYYDMNTLMYVALHELSHVETKASGSESHGDEFKENFTKLLRVAASKGLYDPNKPIPNHYCGISD